MAAFFFRDKPFFHATSLPLSSLDHKISLRYSEYYPHLVSIEINIMYFSCIFCRPQTHLPTKRLYINNLLSEVSSVSNSLYHIQFTHFTKLCGDSAAWLNVVDVSLPVVFLERFAYMMKYDICMHRGDNHMYVFIT